MEFGFSVVDKGYAENKKVGGFIKKDSALVYCPDVTIGELIANMEKSFERDIKIWKKLWEFIKTR